MTIAFDKALKILNVNNKCNVAMVGDQLLTDIKEANDYGLYSILVNPVSQQKNIQTKTQRILQRKIESHLQKKDIFDKERYYIN